MGQARYLGNARNQMRFNLHVWLTILRVALIYKKRSIGSRRVTPKKRMRARIPVKWVIFEVFLLRRAKNLFFTGAEALFY